ncbi:MAG: hypothetical protein ACPGSB_08810 [Opitutales bacterium]
MKTCSMNLRERIAAAGEEGYSVADVASRLKKRCTPASKVVLILQPSENNGRANKAVGTTGTLSSWTKPE